MPQISVVMSVFNGEKYLKECIESILAQTFKDFEFIIIDDCSTDQTPSILQEYHQQDSRIKIVTKDRNNGLKGFIENLNIGLAQAKGKYIARMDADDISFPDRFKKQKEFLDSNPDIFIVGAQVNFINKTNDIIGEIIAAIRHDEIVQKMTSQIQLFHPVIMFRRIPAVYYREKFLYCEDYDLYLNLITDEKKLANLDEKLLNYRILNNSISREGNSFVKKLMVEKALLFYQLRKIEGADTYDKFDNREVLEIQNIDYKNSKAELIFAMKTAIKLNDKIILQFLIEKFKKFYPTENISLKYKIFSISPLIVFRALKKILV